MQIKNSALYKILRRCVYLCTIHPQECFLEKERKLGKSNKFSSIKQYEGIHKGQRCFIVATDPSLNTKDYLKLKNEHTIGVNALCLWFKEQKMETEYFVVSDDDVFKRIESILDKAVHTKVFISERIQKHCTVPTKYQLFPVNIWNRFTENSNKKRFSNDISVCSYDEETVVFHAIQLAVYMGFKEIYLLGTDCNYNQKKNYAVDHGKEVDKTLGFKMLKSYEVVKKYEKVFGFKIFNVTRGGMLEIFERKNLDEILADKKLF